MNPGSFVLSRQAVNERREACTEYGHDWTEPDPVTKRQHCRRCTAWVGGIPDGSVEKE